MATTTTKTFGKQTRSLPLQKAAKYYPAVLPTAKAVRAKHNRTRLRNSITPGTVLILLAGRFAGKRVVFLKQLESGLLLVSGPFKLNGVPLRRVNQAYVIATSTKLDISAVKTNVTDAFFVRESTRGPKPEQAFFLNPENKVALAEEKKTEQKVVDAALLAAVKKAGPTHAKYLATTFSLSNADKPHMMRF